MKLFMKYCAIFKKDINISGEYFTQSYDDMNKNQSVFMKKYNYMYNFISACELCYIN